MTGQVDLSGLKDIILPIKPDWFPPAIGWWWIALLVVIAILGIISAWIHIHFSPLKYALRELKKKRHETKSPIHFAKEVSLLIKRVAIFRFGAQKVAGLSDEAWARFLSMHAFGKIDADLIKFVAFSAYLPDNGKQRFKMADVYHAGRLLIQNTLKGKTHERHNHK